MNDIPESNTVKSIDTFTVAPDATTTHSGQWANTKSTQLWSNLRKQFLRSPYLVYFPFLLYSIWLIIHYRLPGLHADEIRYVELAKNLIHGYYSPFPKNINLWNGPGYPIILMPFAALHVPMVYAALINALFHYLSIVFVHKALALVANKKTALLCGLLLAVYPNALSVLPLLYTEAFTVFLVSAFIYSVTLYYTKKKNKYLFIAGLVLGYLTLTKIIIGYVIVICLAVCLGMLLFKKNRKYYAKSATLLLIAFAVTVPYLAYTYYITGKVFYWGNSGGMSLYWMSTPFEREYGDWKVPSLKNTQYPYIFKSKETAMLLQKNHAKEINFILHKHNPIEQDALFKQIALQNIKAHPLKFATNYYYNVSRMLFNFPYSYAYQDSAIIGNIIRGSLMMWASLLSILLTVYNWRKVIYPIKFILLVTGVYLLLSGALSAYPRQLDVVVPVLLFWIGYLIAKTRLLSLRFVKKRRVRTGLGN
jgi:4-amino-4-deoxy-L-arabinose transferase-like glycosyltransferase